MSKFGPKLIFWTIVLLCAGSLAVIPQSNISGNLISLPNEAQQTMANSISVAIASDQSAVPSNQSGTWTVQPGNTANTTPWLTDDAATSATGSAVPAQANYVAGIGSGNTLGFVNCDNQAFLNMTTATTTELVALTSGQRIRICHIRLISNGTTTVTFKRGTGTNCATGTTAIDADYQLTAQTGFSAGNGVGEVLNGGADANAVCVTNSAAVNLGVFVRYTKY